MRRPGSALDKLTDHQPLACSRALAGTTAGRPDASTTSLLDVTTMTGGVATGTSPLGTATTTAAAAAAGATTTATAAVGEDTMAAGTGACLWPRHRVGLCVSRRFGG